MKCQECKFFEVYYEGSSGGNCRRYAPAIGQPEVGVNDWCGEFCPTPHAVDAPKPCDNFRKARDGKCFNCGCEQSAHH